MRFSIADLLIVVVVLCCFLAANTIEREGHFVLRKSEVVIMDIRYTYFGFPLKAYQVGDMRSHWQPLGVLANSALTVAASAATVFVFRFVRRKNFLRNPPDESSSVVDPADRKMQG